jgi:hypothetical protein
VAKSPEINTAREGEIKPSAIAVSSQLLLYLAAKPRGWIREPFRGVAEHASVMSMVLVSSYLTK